ncbi:glycosyl transferase [Bacteroidia bacterium]|nr:glycosyl transferase [Bacteroidia bacterium]
MKTKVLIDLCLLDNLNTGLGQVSYSFGEALSKVQADDMDFTFLVPKTFAGKFGTQVSYLAVSKKYRYFPFLLPKFDVWHCISHRARYVPVDFKTKIIFTIHDLVFHLRQGVQRKRTIRRTQQRINEMDCICTISNYVAGDIRSHFDLKGKTIEVVYNGIQQMDANQEKRPDFIQPERPYFFTIGQISERKNFGVLLDMMKLMPEYDLYIAGENFREAALQMKAKIEIEQITNVFLPGTVTEEEKNYLYNHSQAFFFPSLFEGFGMPVIEAMRLGKPVFSSTFTSLKEIGKTFSFYWENFEPKYMKTLVLNGLADFYTHPEKIEAQKQYASLFSYEKNVEAYLNIYRKVAKEKKKRNSLYTLFVRYFTMMFH